jgi:hypothetical protein
MPASTATIAARLTDGTSHPAIFAYEKNAPMKFNFTTPGRRIGFYMNTSAPPRANENGWSLFDGAVDWATRP